MKTLKAAVATLIIISLIISCFGFAAAAVDLDKIKSMDNLLDDGGFEEGFGSAIVNVGDSGETAVMTRVVKNPEMASNSIMKVTGRTGGTKTSGLMYDVTSILKEKDALDQYKYLATKGLFYMTAKIKLVNAGDTAYARPGIFTTGSSNTSCFIGDGTVFCAVNSTSWTECGIRTGSDYLWIADLRAKQTEAEFNNVNFKAKIMFSMSTGASSGAAEYLGDYYVDDVSLFFIEGNTTWSQPSPRGTNLLTNGSFETPADYNAITDWTGVQNSWMKETPSAIAIETVTEPVGGAVVDPAGVHTGNAGVLISNRTGAQQGLSVNMKPIVDVLGALEENEKYHLSVWMKAKAPGTTIKVSPIWGAGGSGNAYLNGDATLAVNVTDQWTEVGFDLTEDEYYAFRREGEDAADFNPQNSAWTSIRFKTDGMQDYYADDFKVMKYMPPTQEELDALEAQRFDSRVEALFPVTLDKKDDIKAARARYNALSAGAKALCNIARLEQAEAELQKLINDEYKQFEEPKYKRGDNLLTNGGFEQGFLPVFYPNQTEDTLKAADITLVSNQQQGDGQTSQALHVKDRIDGQKVAGPQYDMLDILKSNGSKGTYFMSAKIKLDNADDTAYICPYLQGGNPGEDTTDDNVHSVKLMLAGGTAYQINGKEYTEIGLGTDGAYIPFSICDKNSGLTDQSIALTKWFKFHFQMYAGAAVSNDTPAYSGDYLIDDITLWFVPEENMPSDGKITVIGPNLLDDGTFETDYDYDSEPQNGPTWYASWVEFLDENNVQIKPPEKGCTLAYKTVSTAPASTLDPYGVHAGNFGVKVTNRPGANQGVALNMKRLVDRVGPLTENEHYYISFYMRAEPGKEFFVIPIFGAKANEGEGNANGYVGGAEPNIKVTDQWTHVGFDLTKQQYMAVMKENKTKFDPYGRDWASIRIQTAGETYGVFDNYYIDDVSVWVSSSGGSANTGDQSNVLLSFLLVLSSAMLIVVCKKSKLFRS